MKRFQFITIFLAAGFMCSAQQDPQYNLYQFNQMVINPAFAGSRDALQVTGAHRQQWLGFPGAPVTTCLSLHAPVLNKKLGVGLTLINDEIGPRNVMSAYANVAYILKINQRLKLNFGVSGGYNRYQFNFSEIEFFNGEAPAELYQNINPGTFDLNSGLYLRSSSFFLGVSATHLNAPNVYTFEPSIQNGNKFTYRLRSHLFITAGKSFLLGNKVVFAPTVLYKQLGSVNSFDVNLNFLLFKKLWLGGFYRHGYGAGALMQYFITDKVKVGYSYDTGLQEAGRLGGSHEIMLGFDFLHQKSHFTNPRFL